MAVLQVIEWFDESGEELVHRIPESGSAETTFGSQLVVRENQSAVFFRDGKAMDVLGPGRHTLSTQNIPVLAKLVTRVVGFGSTSPFRVEVLFVNNKVFTNLRWGTSDPVAFKDSELGLVRLRAFGNYTMKIKNPLLFINTIVGTQGMYMSEQIHEYLKDVIIARLNDLLGETLDTIFNLPKIYDELGVAAKTRVQGDFDKYGLELIDFFVQSITPPEEVQKIIDDRSAMGAVGDMGKFMQFKAAKAMGDAAQNPGGGAGGTAAAGMGVGVGAGLGMMVPGMVLGAMAQGGATAAGPKIKCSNCGAENPGDAKFCAKCGTQMAVGVKCGKCGNMNDGTAKFCSNCGNPLNATMKCANCKADIPAGSKFCPSCGNKIG
jgi:membrane protease subunit (stomatin/prohibitin family)